MSRDPATQQVTRLHGSPTTTTLPGFYFFHSFDFYLLQHQRHIFHPLRHSPNVSSGQGLGRASASNLELQLAQPGGCARNQILEPSPASSSARSCHQKLSWEWHPGTPMREVGIPSSLSTALSTPQPLCPLPWFPSGDSLPGKVLNDRCSECVHEKGLEKEPWMPVVCTTTPARLPGAGGSKL